MQDARLYTTLAFAGALPFIACAVLPIVGIDAAEPFGQFNVLASTYGLGIISFIAGAHWATYHYRQAETPFNLLISSNIIFLAVWFAFVIAGIKWILTIQLIAFMLLVLVDYRLLRVGIISNNYFRVRSIATAIASMSLLTILAAA